jgi:hypothetical protein
VRVQFLIAIMAAVVIFSALAFVVQRRDYHERFLLPARSFSARICIIPPAGKTSSAQSRRLSKGSGISGRRSTPRHYGRWGSCRFVRLYVVWFTLNLAAFLVFVSLFLPLLLSVCGR